MKKIIAIQLSLIVLLLFSSNLHARNTGYQQRISAGAAATCVNINPEIFWKADRFLKERGIITTYYWEAYIYGFKRGIEGWSNRNTHVVLPGMEE